MCNLSQCGFKTLTMAVSPNTEFEFAVTHEGALDAGDILDRRTRIGLVAADRDRALAAAEEILSASN